MIHCQRASVAQWRERLASDQEVVGSTPAGGASPYNGPVTPAFTVLAGGVGAARFLQGLVRVADPAAVTVVSNVADDVEMFGLHVSPDVDIVIYSIAGVVNPETGWGLAGDTFAVADALRRFGYERWFNLGDRDLATAVHRTCLLRAGRPMHEVVAELARAFGVGATILPAANERVATFVRTADGELAFQDYMVRLAAEPEVTGLRFAGAEEAVPAPGALDAIRDAERLVIAPSNPFLSIGPILAVPGLREAVAASCARRIAVSPIVGGEAVKGPAARMLASLGHEVSATGVAAIYRGLIDVMVIDERDRALAPRIEALGLACAVTDTMMTSPERKAALAAFVAGL